MVSFFFFLSLGESDSSSEDQFLSKSIGDKENESAIPMHLPPMQRQLFMRIRQQQLHQLQQPDVEELSEGTTKKNTLSSHEEKHAETSMLYFSEKHAETSMVAVHPSGNIWKK